MHIPVITDDVLVIRMASRLPDGASFSGMPEFDQAIQCVNQGSRVHDKLAKAQHDRRAIELFKSAIERGIDLLREGYAHASIGELLIELDDLPGAVRQFAHVFSARETLPDTLHIPAQYLGIILARLGRHEEAAILRTLVENTHARLRHRLSDEAVAHVRKLLDSYLANQAAPDTRTEQKVAAAEEFVARPEPQHTERRQPVGCGGSASLKADDENPSDGEAYDGEASDGEATLDRIVAEYLIAREANEALNDDEWLARYPQYAGELAEFFAANKAIGQFMEPAGMAPTDPFLHVPPRNKDSSQRNLNPNVVGFRRLLQPGDVLASRYRVMDIKSGGMGVVYIAKDLDAETDGYDLTVGIKTIRDYEDWQAERRARGAETDRSYYDSLAGRFRREALEWVRLGLHNNIILAQVVFEVGVKPHLVMEYADSGDLRQWIREARLTTSLAINFARQFCEGMQHAVATSGLVHRDIKPANLLIKNDRYLKIADFGLAKAFDADLGDALTAIHSSDSRLQSQLGAGTRPYMPPEQFESLANADTRSDIFSFGATFFEMLTGRQLFARRDAFQMAAGRVPLPLAHEVYAEVPMSISAIAARCLQYDPGSRYQTFADLASDLRNVDVSLGNSADLPGDPKSVPKDFYTPSIHALGEAYALISLGRHEEAASKAQAGIDADPEDYQHWVNKSKALVELRQYDEARQCCIEACRLRPDMAICWANLGWAEYALSHYDDALTAAKKATRLDNQFADGWNCRGCCEEKMGSPSAAIDSLRKAAAHEQHNWKCRVNLGQMLNDAGRFHEAINALRQAVEINPTNATLWEHYALTLANGGQMDEARFAIEKSIELNDGIADSWGLRAVIHLNSGGDKATARSFCEQALAINPGNDAVRKILDALRS